MIISFFISYLITFLLTPISRKFFSDRSIFDQPNFRSQRSIPIVRTGGLSIFISFILTFLLCWKLGIVNLVDIEQFGLIIPILLISSLFFLIGFIDDLIYLSPFLRLGIQFSAASIVWLLNLKINFINLFWFNNIELSDILS